MQAPTCLVLLCPVLWKLFKSDSTVEEVPTVFSPVVNLKHSTWFIKKSEAKFFQLMDPGPAELLLQNLTAFSLVDCFTSMSSETIFHWEIIEKLQYIAEASCPLEHKLCSLQCAEGWHFPHILLITVGPWERTQFFSVW